MKARTPTTPRGQSTPQRKFPRTTDGVHRTTFSLTLSARCESLGPGFLGVLTAVFALAMQALDPSHPESSRPRSISVSTDDPSGMAKAQQPPNGYFPPPCPTHTPRATTRTVPLAPCRGRPSTILRTPILILSITTTQVCMRRPTRPTPRARAFGGTRRRTLRKLNISFPRSLALRPSCLL